MLLFEKPPELTTILYLGPYAGLLCAEYGASVLRIDRPHPQAHQPDSWLPTSDLLTRYKSSIALNLKEPASRSLFLSLIGHVDVLIDPYRPGVLEKLELDPSSVLLHHNPRLIIARLTGFRRDGKYKDMAGHDINYLAVSGVLSLLGASDRPPLPPINILADFGGGGAIAFTGILLALLARNRTGRGQVVEANMVDGAGHLATSSRILQKTPIGNHPRGTNLLDGGSPFYASYETKDGRYVAVGALEPQFYAELLKGLGLKEEDVLPQDIDSRGDRKAWPFTRGVFRNTFLSKTRSEWEQIFDGTDACVTPVLTYEELEDSNYQQRSAVTLTETPARDVNTDAGSGWVGVGIGPGEGGEETLRKWLGWERGKHFHVANGSLVSRLDERQSKL